MRRALPPLVLVLLAACGRSTRQDVLTPISPENRAVNTLFWVMTAIGMVVWAAVTVAAVWAALARRRREGEVVERVVPVAAETHRRATRTVAGLVGASALVLLGLLVYDFGVGRALAQHPARARTIEIVGHQWWWEIRYVDPDPSKIAVDANELHLPAGEKVQIKLTAQDVIHSFWVPNIIGKRDLIPGYTTSLYLDPDRPGTFRSQCAEYCGQQHAKMAMMVVVHPPGEFERWLQQARQPATPPPSTDTLATQGRRVFLAGPCVMCHGITGEPAYGTVGPDLTHLASRRTLAAGTLPNTRGNLAGWIVDPQSIKPGVKMPSNQLQSRDLRALLAYLETLK